MDYMDTYLRATDKKTLDAVLDAAGVLVNGEVALVDALDPVGQDPTRIVTDEKGELVEQVMPGYHANLRTAKPLTDEQLKILADVIVPTPANPIRAWL